MFSREGAIFDSMGLCGRSFCERVGGVGAVVSFCGGWREIV
jgi:hypothetical protein